MSAKKDRNCSTCGVPVTRFSRTGLCAPCSQAKQARERTKPKPLPLEPSDQLAVDRAKSKLTAELARERTNYREALKTIEGLEQQLGAVRALRSGVEPFAITPKESSGTSEATPVWVASDWHVEESVGPEVGGLNRYSLEIAQQRATQFFQHGLRLTRLLAQDVKISSVVLALLGDFITNDIHDAENAEKNAALPNHALVHAQNLIISGLEFLLNHSPFSFVIPCHSGNHARTTQKTRFGAENGHSLEYLMYLHLAAYFRNEPRVTFLIPEGMHSYVDVYNQTIRFHHGHAVKYGGGVGGIYIPVNKAIAQWNKARRADLDVFGHFHQMRDGGNFICNGSLIGYNAFALSIKADYEPPKQALFLLDKKRGRTCTWPILFSK
jgi:hypothetical protein